MPSRVEGLERLKAKVLGRLTAAAKAETKKANKKNADEFEQLVRQHLPKGDDKNGHLVETLHQEDSGETGVAVVLGDAAHPYPLHLEAGHRNKDGSHTPGKPVWNPARQVMKKRAKGRAARAASKAVKDMVGS